MNQRHRAITKREYWPTILLRLDELAREGVSPSAAAMIISKEFKCPDTTVYSAMQRGEVTCYHTKDHARARAWQEGRSRYLRGNHCVKCESRVFYSSIGVCVACSTATDTKRHDAQNAELKSARATDGDFYTGACEFADDKVFCEPLQVQQPLKRGSTQHTMADAMLNGATLDDLAMLTGWHPNSSSSAFMCLKPKGYGVARRGGRYYLSLADGVETLSIV